MSDYPTKRNATRHAWKRLSKAIGPGEGRDIAADIAAIIEVEAGEIELVKSIEFALTGFNWEARDQA